MKITHIIGIDEVGRGPLAGPVTVCALTVPNTKHSVFGIWVKGVKDSKQLTAKERGVWFEKIKSAKKRGELDFAVTSVSAKIIDTRGISYAIRSALQSSIFELSISPKKCMVLLDGGLKAPAEFIFQKTIIKGDEKEPVIALASIVAKVTGDALMMKMHKKYRNYRFDLHKGYGTKLHFNMIKHYGLSSIHRQSFIHC
ncbi:MAG: ribonuclease HII [Candidatus Taylorbacteria bacterium]|nr:ribonuclease HII [Candidatus Taylorbacteria bacterium]